MTAALLGVSVHRFASGGKTPDGLSGFAGNSSQEVAVAGTVTESGYNLNPIQIDYMRLYLGVFRGVSCESQTMEIT
jgi:hypothetical protein